LYMFKVNTKPTKHPNVRNETTKHDIQFHNDLLDITLKT
jgi:hypothetical protein